QGAYERGPRAGGGVARPSTVSVHSIHYGCRGAAIFPRAPAGDGGSSPHGPVQCAGSAGVAVRRKNSEMGAKSSGTGITDRADRILHGGQRIFGLSMDQSQPHRAAEPVLNRTCLNRHQTPVRYQRCFNWGEGVSLCSKARSRKPIPTKSIAACWRRAPWKATKCEMPPATIWGKWMKS